MWRPRFCHVAGRKFGYNSAELGAFLTSWIALAHVEPYQASDVEAAIRARLDGGDSARDAAAAVAAELGVPKRQAYEVANRLS